MKSIIKIFLILLLVSFCSNAQSYRDTWQKPAEIMDSLNIRSGMTIGEIGAGEGYFTLHLSERVNLNGKVYANDINKNALNKLADKIKQRNIKNIEIIQGEFIDPKFPVDNFDVLVMMYVIHDIEKPVEFLKSCAKYMKKSKQIIIIDRDPDKFGQEYSHFWTKDKINEVVEEAGYSIVKTMTFLPRDNIYLIQQKD